MNKIIEKIKNVDKKKLAKRIAIGAGLILIGGLGVKVLTAKEDSDDELPIGDEETIQEEKTETIDENPEES